MVRKKAFLKTVEAVIAIFISLLFLTIVIPHRNPADSSRSESIKLLDTLKENENFRNCILTGNRTCINATIRANLENRFDFTFNISSDPDTKISLPARQIVFAEGIMVAGNSTDYNPRILRVYYWIRPAQ